MAERPGDKDSLAFCAVVVVKQEAGALRVPFGGLAGHFESHVYILF